MRVHHQIKHHEPSNTLHVIAVVSNPVGYKSRYELFKKFRSHMEAQNVNLIIVELALGQRDHQVTESDNPNHIQVRGNSELWHKENMINIGFSRLPLDWEYAAWIDGDIAFLNPNWVHDTLNALQHHRVVQMFQDCVDTGPSGEVLQVHRSFGYQYVNVPEKMALANNGYYGKGVAFPHPGYAWAIRKDAFNGIGRLIDWAILGSADHHMAWAFIGDVKKSVMAGIHPKYMDRLLAFQSRCDHFIQKDLGYVPGIITHDFHGKKKDRKYQERWSILLDHGYDPDTDIKYNSHGVLELDGRNIKLRDAIRQYLRQRNEDSIDLE